MKKGCKNSCKGMGGGTGKNKGNTGKKVDMKGVKSATGKTRMPNDRRF